MIRYYFSQSIRIILLLMFCYTTYHKLIDLNKFEATLLKSTLIEEYQVKYLLYIIPSLELVAVFFLLRKNYRVGFFISFFLMLLFTLYLVALNNYSFYKGCSCGGIFNEMSYSQHIIINISFILLSVVGIFIYSVARNKST